MVTSSGKEGFKHAQKKTTQTGMATGAAAALKIIRRGITTVRVIVKGIGPGRMTAVKAMAVAGINVVSVSKFV
jgi:small subunit ribosomal protein S11